MNGKQKPKTANEALDEYMPRTPGDALRYFMRRDDISDYESVALLTGLTHYDVSLLGQGHSRIDLPTAEVLARLFDTKPEYWIGLQKYKDRLEQPPRKSEYDPPDQYPPKWRFSPELIALIIGGVVLVLALWWLLSGVPNHEAKLAAQCDSGEVYIGGAYLNGRFCVQGRRIQTTGEQDD